MMKNCSFWSEIFFWYVNKAVSEISHPYQHTTESTERIRTTQLKGHCLSASQLTGSNARPPLWQHDIYCPAGVIRVLMCGV